MTATVPTGAPNPVYTAAEPFLARSAALAASTAPTAPSPAPENGNLGSFGIGHSPRLFAPRVIEGASVGVAGLVALIALVVLGIVRRRHPPVSRRVDEPRGAVISADATGTVWHDIVEAAPTESEWFR
jgi:hypothetical protein